MSGNLHFTVILNSKFSASRMLDSKSSSSGTL